MLYRKFYGDVTKSVIAGLDILNVSTNVTFTDS